MPAWATIVVGIAAFILACHTIWTKFVRPGSKLVTTVDKFMPVAAKLSEEFAPSPELLETLSEIARQFRPDRGSSLRDVIDRVDARIASNTDAIKALGVKLDQIHEDLRKRGTA